MTKFTVTDTALKAGEPWGHAPIHVELVDSTGAAVSPAYVDATGVLVEAFDTVADGDGVFTLTLDSTADISPTGCFYLVRIGDADNIISGDDGDGTVRGLRASTPTVLGSTATFDGLADVNMAGKADGDVPTWDTTTGRYIPGTGGGGGGGVSSVSGTAPITSTGGATPAIGITAATSGAAGSMSAADKSKLDGIEAGATADQSAAELLTAIKTVDGTGSGLDADTVDGQHASAFEAAGTAAALVDDLSGVSNAATARTNLGLGDSATKNVGTGAGSVAAGDHNHTGVYEAVGVAAALVDDLSGVSNAATARTNLGLGSLATLSTITSGEITDGTIVNADISASAAIALSKLSTTGTPGATNFLRGDGAWTVVPSPYLVSFLPWLGSSPNTNFDTRSANSAALGNGYLHSAGAQNAEVTFNVALAAGTWTLKFLYAATTGGGIYTVSLDGSSLGTVDSYNGSTTYNNVGTLSGFTVSAPGVYALNFKMATKNASSSNYYGFLQHIALYRTGA